MKAIFAVIAIAACASGASAQTVYRCGSTYSATPCGADQRQLSVGVGPDKPEWQRKLKRVHDLSTPEQRDADEKTCRDGIRRKLKDPESARFEDVTRVGVYEVSPNSNRTLARYGGYVNAKNSYGGYTGPKMFSCDLNTDGSLSSAHFLD